MNKLLVLFLLTTNLFLASTANLSSLPTIQCSEYGIERVEVEDGDDPFILLPRTKLALVTLSFVDIFSNIVNKPSSYTLTYNIRAPPV